MSSSSTGGVTLNKQNPKYSKPSNDFQPRMPITRPDLGHHLMMTFTAADPHLVNSAQLLVDAVTPILQSHGCSVINVKAQQFEPMGATVVWTLAESHFSIHTWPEHHTCVIDFFTCQLNASEICDLVQRDCTVLFGAEHNPRSILECISIARGKRMVQCNKGAIKGQENCMLLYGKSEQKDSLLFEGKSPYQHVKIVDTGKTGYGKILLLDGIIQIAETTDFYSGALTTPVQEAKGLANTLIIGGGDCKIAKRLFKLYPNQVNKVTVVDIDQMVTDSVLAHFPSLNFTGEEKQKVSIHWEDAAQWCVRQAEAIAAGKAPKFTGAIIDCTDPAPAGGVSRSLFTPQFYSTLAKCLVPGAVITQQYSHDANLDFELEPLKTAGFTNIAVKECNQLEYFFPLNIVEATAPGR